MYRRQNPANLPANKATSVNHRHTMMSHFATRLSISLLLLASVTVSAASPAIAAGDGHLVIGRISQEPRKHFDRLTAMANYLTQELAGDGITNIHVFMVAEPQEMEEMLAGGQVDLLSETPFVALNLAEKGLAEILMREWKKGVAEYHSVIVARKDGPVQRLADLAGRRVAFEDAGSTSGYLMPHFALEQAGLPLRELTGSEDTVRPGETGYSFANGEINVVAWVHRGRADAGAISNLDWNSKTSAPAHFKKDLRIIHRTEPVIRSVFMARAGLDDAIKQRVKAVLESMHESPEGRTAMKKYFKVARYDRLTGEALAGLENARRIRRTVAGHTD